jgi:hypothetical protein
MNTDDDDDISPPANISEALRTLRDSVRRLDDLFPHISPDLQDQAIAVLRLSVIAAINAHDVTAQRQAGAAGEPTVSAEPGRARAADDGAQQLTAVLSNPRWIGMFRRECEEWAQFASDLRDPD